MTENIVLNCLLTGLFQAIAALIAVYFIAKILKGMWDD